MSKVFLPDSAEELAAQIARDQAEEELELEQDSSLMRDMLARQERDKLQNLEPTTSTTSTSSASSKAPKKVTFGYVEDNLDRTATPLPDENQQSNESILTAPIIPPTTQHQETLSPADSHESDLLQGTSTLESVDVEVVIDILKTSKHKSALIQSSGAIYNYSRDIDKHRLLRNRGCIGVLLDKLDVEYKEVRRFSLLALTRLTANSVETKMEIRRLNAFDQIGKLLQNDSDLRAETLVFLNFLCHEDEFNKERVVESGVVSTLVTLLENFHPLNVRTYAVTLIGNLCYNNQACQILVHHDNGLKLILDCVQDSETAVSRQGLFALNNLVTRNQDIKHELRGRNGIKMLISLLKSETLELRVDILLCIYNALSNNDENKFEFLDQEGLNVLLINISIKNIQVQLAALAILRLFLFERFKTVQTSAVVKALLSIVRTVSHQVAMRSECMRLLLVMVNLNQEMEFVFHEVEGLQAIFRILEDDEQTAVHQLAIRLLIVMTKTNSSTLQFEMRHMKSVQIFVKLLSKHEQSEVQRLTAVVVNNFCVANPQIAQEVHANEGILPLVSMLSNTDKPRLQEQAAFTLRNLAVSNNQIRDELLSLGGLKPIQDMIAGSHENNVIAGLRLLVLMCQKSQGTIREYAGKLRGIQPLVELLSTSENVVVQSRVCFLLMVFASHSEDMKTTIVLHEAMPVLTFYLRSKTPQVRLCACGCLKILCCNMPAIKHVFRKCKGIKGALTLCVDSDPKIQEEGLKLIATIAYKNDQNKKALKHQGANKKIFPLTDPETNGETVAMAARRAMRNMGELMFSKKVMGNKVDVHKTPVKAKKGKGKKKEEEMF